MSDYYIAKGVTFDKSADVMENLENIKKLVEDFIAPDIIIADIVYRPFSAGVLGTKGYTVVLAILPDYEHGFVVDVPTENNILAGVRDSIIILREAKDA